VPRTAACFRYFGGMADKFQGDVVPVEAGFLNYLLREPVGVVGQVVPWNFPLMFTSWKMAPALAAGNCIVMKPAEITPLSSLRIAELMSEAGMPDGVVNIVPGLGSVAGQAIAEHERIAKIAFTGSTATGRRIVTASAGNLKKVQLELGGKGANIVFDDANLIAAVNGSAWAIFHNQGQACIAGSRLMLHEKIADEFLDRFTTLASSIRLGNPLDAATEMGPLTSAQHRDRVLGYVDVARAQGGTVLAGGKPPAAKELAAGCYVEPTIVRAKHFRDRIAQEEVFGPFVTGADVQGRRRGASRSRTAPTTASAAASGRATCSGPTASPATCAPAWSGSTATSASIRVRRSAASANPATVARWASTRCASTRRSRACGSTSTRRFRRGIRVEPMVFTYTALPSRVVFGAGALQQLAREIEAIGATRALVLSTPEQVESARRVAALLGDRAVGVFAEARMHVPDRYRAGGARRGEAARRRLRGRDRRRLDDRSRQGDRARSGLGRPTARRSRSSRSRRPMPAAR
jgi:hypothetical protein